MVALFNRYEMKTVTNVHFRFLVCSEPEMSPEKKLIDTLPLPHQLMIICMGRHLGTNHMVVYGSCLWNVKMGIFSENYEMFSGYPIKCNYVCFTCFILKCLKMPRNQDSVSPVCEFKNPLKIILHIWAPPDSHFLDKKKNKKNYPSPP